MPARSRRTARGLAVGALAAVAVRSALKHPSTAAVGAEEGSKGATAQDVIGYPLGLRHQLSVDSPCGKFRVEGVSQGKDQWAVALGEKLGGGVSPVAVAQKLGGEPATYAVTYDSGATNFKPPLAPGVEGVRFSATGAEGDEPSAADWSLRVSGKNGNHLSATVDDGELVYEGAFTHEQPVADGLSAMYAVDLKRRAASGSLAPGWFRHGLGLRYSSDLGDFKVNVHQPSPDGPEGDVELEAIYSGDLAGKPGSPTYSLAASRAAGESNSYEGSVKVKGPEGVTGGLSVGVKDGAAKVSGWTDLSAHRDVADGVGLSASTRVVASPDGAELRPINLKATADLASLVPDLMAAGSRVSADARYKLGEDRPALSASAVLNPRPVGPLSLGAEGRVTDSGDVSGKVSASASVGAVDATYTASKVAGKQVHHVGQAVYTPDASGAPRLYGRVTQSEKDHDGKPRLQLGMMYDFNAKGVQFAGSSHAFDSGDVLVDEQGQPWRNGVYNKAKNTAEVLRTRVRGDAAEGHQWLRKRQNFGD